MAFESLTERLQGVFKNLRRKGKLSEKEVQEVTKEIRLALLEADVALPVVKTFIKRVRERAVGHEIIDTLDASQQIIKIVNEELTEILGSETSEIEKSPKIPTIIMMVGLQGAGKTTFAGKLANKLIKEQEKTGFIVLHDPLYAFMYCDRILLMKDGRIIDEIIPLQETCEIMTYKMQNLYPQMIIQRDQDYQQFYCLTK